MSRSSLLLSLVLVCGVPFDAVAQSENYTLRVNEENSGSPGATTDVPVFLDSAAGSELLGLSFGVCHDPSHISIDSSSDIALGSALAALNDGDGPDFNGVTIVSGEGWTAGMIVVLVGAGSLGAADGQELYVASYTVEALGTSEIEFCEIGSPTVSVLVVEADGEVAPTTQSGSLISTVSLDPVFEFSISDSTLLVNDGESVPFFARVSIAQVDTAVDPIETSGFSMGIAIDPDFVAVDLVDLPGSPVEIVPCFVPAGVLAAVNDGDGPDFFGVNDPTGGITVGVVYSLVGSGDSIVFSAGGDDVIEIGLSTVEGAFTGEDTDPTTVLDFSEELGDPLVPNVLVASGGAKAYSVAQSEIATEPGTVSIALGPGPVIQGDCNDDSRYDIADAIYLLNHLFHPPGQPAPAPGCELACSVNGDGKLDSSDAIFILNHQFRDGPAPIGPTGCSESDPEKLSCEIYTGCD